MIRKRFLHGCLQVMATAALAAAPAGAQSIELEALEVAALADSPAIAEARAGLKAARALTGAATAPADPRLELWARNLVPGDLPSELEVEVVQPVRFPGKRQAAESVAAAAVAVAEAELVLASRQVLSDVRTTFAELVALDREQRALAEAHDLLEMIAETANVRFGAGQQPALDVLEAELAMDEHDLEVERVYARFLAERARLATLAGLDPKELPFLVGTLPAAPLPADRKPLAVDPEAPRLAAFRARLAAAERGLELAELDRRPDFGVGAGFAWPEDDSPELLARFGIDLPFFRRRRVEPRIAAAAAEVEAARAALRVEELAAASDAARLTGERERLERSLAKLSGAIVPRTSAALDAGRIAFLNGEVPFARLLGIQRDWFHARVEMARAESELYAVWAEWQEWAPDADAAVPAAEEVNP